MDIYSVNAKQIFYFASFGLVLIDTNLCILIPITDENIEFILTETLTARCW